MSRELILILKLRYEQLLKQEQKPEQTVELSSRKQLPTNEKDRVSKQDLPEGNLENTTVNQSSQQAKSETLDDVHQPHIQRTSVSEVINSKERGKKTYQEKKTSKWWE